MDRASTPQGTPPSIDLPGCGLSLWYGRALAVEGLSDGEARLAAAAERPCLDRVRAGEPQGPAGPARFLDLPYPGSPVQPVEVLDRIAAWAARLRGDATLRQVVWVGLGGSVLGPQMLVRALGDGLHPIHFVDTLDPHGFAAGPARLDPAKTHYVLVSKSGTTAETALLGGWILERLADPASRLTLVTGPSGPLAGLPGEQFPVPEGIGGRWSVLSPVGLLAATLAGADPHALLEGARAADAAFQAGGADPATLLCWIYARALEAGKSVFPCMAYDDRLALVADWTAQLLMESLGKRYDRAGDEVRRGLTVLPARGTSAQHSMLQEWIDGPPTKCLTFLLAGDAADGPPLRSPLADHPGLAALAGRTPRQVQLALYQGTADALAAAGCPSVSLHLQRVDERAMGALVLLFELVCALWAERLDVNAYDQPGVELGKVRARELLARMGQGGLAADDVR